MRSRPRGAGRSTASRPPSPPSSRASSRALSRAPGPPSSRAPADSALLTRAAADLRLLVPALCAWSAVALLLGAPADHAVVVAGGSLLVAGGLAVAWRRTVVRGRPGYPGVSAAWLGTMTLAALATTLALAALAAATGVRDAGPIRDLADQRATVSVLGVVASDPRAVDPPRGRPESAAGVVLRLDVEQVDGRGVRTAVASPVLVFADRTWLDLSWQSRVQAIGRLAPPQDDADDVVAVLVPRGLADAPGGPGLGGARSRRRPRTVRRGDRWTADRCAGAAAGARDRRHLAHARRPGRGHARDGDDAPVRGERRATSRSCSSAALGLAGAAGRCDVAGARHSRPCCCSRSSSSSGRSRASSARPRWARSGCSA